MVSFGNKAKYVYKTLEGELFVILQNEHTKIFRISDTNILTPVSNLTLKDEL